MEAMETDGRMPNASLKSGGTWRSVKSWTFGIALFGMMALNIASLISETIHDIGFGLVKAVFSSVMSNDMLAKMLRESPTLRRKSDVALATKAISDERTAVLAAKRALESEHMALKKVNDEIKGKHAALTHLTEVRSTAVQKVSKRLVARTAINATRNSSSIFAEAIPYVGVAVVLGVTALDLHDACETLKDMNELGNVFDHAPEDESKVCGIKVPSKADVIAKAKSSWKATYETAANALKKEGVQVAPATESQ
jgi:hypothetical protein